MRESWGGVIAFLLLLILIVLVAGRDALRSMFEWTLWGGLALLVLTIAFYFVKGILLAIRNGIAGAYRQTRYAVLHPRLLARRAVAGFILIIFWPWFMTKQNVGAFRARTAFTRKASAAAGVFMYGVGSLIWTGGILAIVAFNIFELALELFDLPH